MTHLLVTLEDDADPNIVKDTISMFRGVKKVEILNKDSLKGVRIDNDLADAPDEIRRLIGIAANLSEKDIAKDDRLSYILSK